MMATKTALEAVNPASPYLNKEGLRRPIRYNIKINYIVLDSLLPLSHNNVVIVTRAVFGT